MWRRFGKRLLIVLGLLIVLPITPIVIAIGAFFTWLFS